MKRAMAVLILAAVCAAAFVPVVECPDCIGVGAAIEHPTIGCPRCGDGGRVSAFGRVRRRPLDPKLSALIVEPWVSTHDGRFSELAIELTARTWRPLSPDAEWKGLAVFADDLVVVLARPAYRPAGPPAIALLLFDREGGLLDGVEIQSAVGVLDLDARLAKGGVLHVEAPTAFQPHRFSVSRGREQEVRSGYRLTIAPSQGRFEVDLR